MISKYFRENIFLITGNENFQTDQDIYIVAVSRRLLHNLPLNFLSKSNRLNFKIRKTKEPAGLDSFSVEYFRKYLPCFHDVSLSCKDILNESEEDEEDIIVSSQHFTDKETSSCCINFKLKKCTEEFPCITPLNHFTPRWVAPRSPHALIEEEFSENPWALLVATVFLTKTTGLQAKPLLWKFLREFPDPISVIWADINELEKYFITLGLTKRATMIQKMSKEFLQGRWRNASDLCGIGQYGEDAYRIFCLAELNFEPCDRYLRLYVDWLNRRDYEVTESSQNDELI